MTVAILVVDDEPDVVELFSQRFRREVRREQFALHFAITGKEALDLLGADLDPNDTVVLIDIRLPDMSGHDLMAEVKRRWPDLPAFTDEVSLIHHIFMAFRMHNHLKTGIGLPEIGNVRGLKHLMNAAMPFP